MALSSLQTYTVDLRVEVHAESPEQAQELFREKLAAIDWARMGFKPRVYENSFQIDLPLK